MFPNMRDLESFHQLIEKQLAAKGISPAAASRLAVGHPYLIYELRKGTEPRFKTLKRLCDTLGLEFYIGPPREPAPELIADPRPPPGLPKGARTLEAAGALGQRFSDEALRDELVSVMREETKALRTATETALKELVSRLPPAAQNLEDDTAQRSPAGGKVLPFVPATESVDDDDFDSVRRYDADEVRLAAGGLGFVDREPLAGEVKFRRDWLGSHRLEAKNLMLLDVIGDSMLPTIEERDSVLIDESRRKPRSGRIYGLRTTDGPLVKRLRKRGGRWWADSDNDKYEPRLMSEEDQTLGRVVWWAHTEE